MVLQGRRFVGLWRGRGRFYQVCICIYVHREVLFYHLDCYPLTETSGKFCADIKSSH